MHTEFQGNLNLKTGMYYGFLIFSFGIIIVVTRSSRNRKVKNKINVDLKKK